MTNIATISDRLDEVMRPLLNKDGPGFVALVQQNGKTLYRQQTGQSCLSSGQRLSLRTRLRVGSTTKQFLGALCLMLDRAGVLSLDEPIGRWIPELRIPIASASLRSLLRHTSGLWDYLDISLLTNGMAQLPKEAGLAYQAAQSKYSYVPGARLVYNNGGYRLASIAVERATGSSLGKALREHLFEPLMMLDTELWESDAQPVPDAARCYARLPSGEFVECRFPTPILGEGGVISTASDLMRWQAHRCNPVLWSAGDGQAMLSPVHFAANGVGGYGLGVITDLMQGERIIHHPGTVIGGSCQALTLPDLNAHVVVLSNRSDYSAFEMAKGLAQALLDADRPARSLPDQQTAGAALLDDSWCGAYAGEDGSELIELAVSGGVVTVKRFGQAFPARSLGDGRFHVNFAGIFIFDCAVSADGQMVLMEFDTCKLLKKLTSNESGDAPAVPFLGTWEIASIETLIRIEDAGPRGVLMRIHGKYGSASYGLKFARRNLAEFSGLDPMLPMQGLVALSKVNGKDALVLNTARTSGLIAERIAH